MPEGPIRLWSVKYRELLLDIPRPLDQRNVIAFSSDVTELVALDLRDGRAGDQIKVSDDAFYCVRLDERIGDFASTSHQAPNEVCRYVNSRGYDFNSLKEFNGDASSHRQCPRFVGSLVSAR